MRKLLKLFAIGMLLAVGSNQAFALLIPSDGLQVSFPSTIVTNFPGTNTFLFFEDGGVDKWQTRNAAGELVLVNVPHPLFTPSVQGAFTLTTGSRALVLTEPGVGISDVLTLTIGPAVPQGPGINRYALTFNFYDGSDSALSQLPFPGLTCQSIGVTCASEALFVDARDVSGALGLPGGSGIVMFRSDVAAIPEPASLLLLAIGVGALGLTARRKRKDQN